MTAATPFTDVDFKLHANGGPSVVSEGKELSLPRPLPELAATFLEYENLTMDGRILYKAGLPLPASRYILLCLFQIFHQPCGQYCSYNAAQLPSGSFFRKQKKT